MHTTTASAILSIPQSRYRSWYNGWDIVLRPRRYGNLGVQWEAYLPDQHGYPDEFLGSGATRILAIEAACDFIDIWNEETGGARPDIRPGDLEAKIGAAMAKADELPVDHLIAEMMKDA